MLVPLNTPEGKDRLEESNHFQQEMVDAFRKQRGSTTCGLASLAVLLTARNRCLVQKQASDPSNSRANRTALYDQSFVTEDDVYPMAESNNNGVIVSDHKIRTSGMTLDQLRCLANPLPETKKAIVYRVQLEDGQDQYNATQVTPTEWILWGKEVLREQLKFTLKHPASQKGLILNYHMTTLGQEPFGGHFSPLAAYHVDSDSVLILDVWPETEPVWAPLTKVWDAMMKPDPESNAPRGLLKVVHKWDT